MSEQIPNPQAFPEHFIYESYKGQYGAYTSSEDIGRGGMSLRDYFAAKVMQGIVSNPNVIISVDGEYISRSAYVIADAMLKQRTQ